MTFDYSYKMHSFFSLYYPISLFKAYQHADPLIRLIRAMATPGRLTLRVEAVILYYICDNLIGSI
jgi:hypothetical protein